MKIDKKVSSSLSRTMQIYKKRKLVDFIDAEFDLDSDDSDGSE